MNSFWTTLIEINLILSIAYLGYIVLLRNLTFFRWTRAYLLGTMLIGLVYPFLKIKQVVYTPAESVNIIIPNIPQVSQTPGFDYNQWTIYIVSAIFLLLSLRFLVRFFSLGKIHFASSNAEFDGREFRNTHNRVNPFSFWKWIYIHRDSHSDFEMRQIVTHEHIHTRERHTFDVLVAEICMIICWYNPVVKLLAKAVKDNLEFLVDAEVLYSGIDKISYQHSLVGISLSGFPQPRHGNQFAFKTLKKRIRMMNKEQSSKFRLLSYMLITPPVLACAGLLTFSCQKEAPDTAEKSAVIEVPVEKETSDTTAKAKKSAVIEVLVEKETPGAVTPTKTPVEVPVEPATASSETGEGSEIRKPSLLVEGFPITPKAYFKDEKPEETIWERTATATYDKDTKASTIESVKLKAFGATQSITFKAQGYEVDNKSNFTLTGPVVIKGTYLSSGNPLYILDGKEIPDLNGLEPNSIQSISVLKDKSAIEKYGEKGKNGAIEILSKKSPR